MFPTVDSQGIQNFRYLRGISICSAQVLITTSSVFLCKFSAYPGKVNILYKQLFHEKKKKKRLEENGYSFRDGNSVKNVFSFLVNRRQLYIANLLSGEKLIPFTMNTF